MTDFRTSLSLRLWVRLACGSCSLAAMLVVICSGCDFPQRPPLGAPENPTASDMSGSKTGSQDVTPVEAPWESWQLYLRGEEPLGYAHATVSLNDRDPKLLDCVTEQKLLVRRGNATVAERLEQTFVQSAEGDLLRYQCEHRVGPWLTEKSVAILGAQTTVTTQRGQLKAQRNLDWEGSFRGPLAIEQSLRSRPMRPGDFRKLTMLEPLAERVIEVRLNCVGEAVVPLLDGASETLFEINRMDLVDGEVVKESVLWIDDSGVVRRRVLPSLNLVAYHAEREQVDAIAEESDHRAAVSVEGSMPNPSKAKMAWFEVVPSDYARRANRSIELAPAPGQCVLEEPTDHWQVLLNCFEQAKQKGLSVYQSPLTQADRQASAIVDYRSKEVAEIERRMTFGADWSNIEIAKDLTEQTHGLTSLDSRSEGIPQASHVAKRAAGDALGQAVLLAALLRSKDIESRVAIGLRYQAPQEGGLLDGPAMVFHAWTVAWDEGRWYPLDATVGGLAPADRITLAILDMADNGEADETLREVVRELADLKIRIRRVKQAD